MADEKLVKPSHFETSDPAHPSQENSDHTTVSGEKPTTIVSAITSPTFFPTLDSAPLSTRLLSHSILLIIIFGGILTCHLYGLSILQIFNPPPPSAIPGPISPPLSQNWAIGPWIPAGVFLASFSAVLLALVIWSGAANLDFYALSVEYWWLSMPAVIMAGAAILLMGERQESIQGVD